MFDSSNSITILPLNMLAVLSRITYRYRSLKERFDLVKKLDNDFPNIDYVNDITKCRNDVAHNRDVFPSNETTTNLIISVERL